MPISPPKIQHINPFISATIVSFKSMVGIDPKPGKAFLKEGRGIHYDISGIIGLSGEKKGMREKTLRHILMKRKKNSSR